MSEDDLYQKKIIKTPIISDNKGISYSGPDISKIYNFPPINNTDNITVGVMSFGGGIYGNIDNNGFLTNSDIQNTWLQQGILPINFPKVIVKFLNGATNNLSDYGATVENTLDVSVIGACCPYSKLTIVLFVFSTNITWSEAFNKVLSGIKVLDVEYVPKIISLSWGSSEKNIIKTLSESTFTSVSNILEKATNNGINICCSTGDYGSTNDTSSGDLDVVFPACCPYVTAVGGTTLNCITKNYDDITTSETVWNTGIVKGKLIATGGGISSYYKKPSYQNNIDGINRLIPDIALVADPNTGFSFILNGRWITVGGTSLSAPIFAAYLARLNNLNNFVNPLLYNNATSEAFHDIINGTNYSPYENNNELRYYTSNKGYDCCTGLGSINGTLLATILTEYIPTPTINLSSPNLRIINIVKYVKDPVFNIKQYIQTNSPGDFIFNSLNENIITIDNLGNINIIGIGSTIITIYQSSTNIYDSAFVKINIDILPVIKSKALTILPSKLIVRQGIKKIIKLKPKILPINTTNKQLLWSSSNIKIATVNNMGLIKINKTGIVNIKCRTTDGSNLMTICKIIIKAN